MRNAATPRSTVLLSRRRWCSLIGCMLVPAMLAGCARSLTIHQDPYINTGGQAGRAKAQRTGEPLEVTAVVVYPDDLRKSGNELLRPDSNITTRDWYERRPERGMEQGGDRFDLPHNQIFVLTNDDRVVGQPIGKALRGAVLDGEKPISKTRIGLKWDMVHNDQTVIYVFPKFIGKDGKVLPVPPARFHPPGAYTSKLEVKIGVQADRPAEEAQYIKVLSRRKLHSPE